MCPKQGKSPCKLDSGLPVPPKIFLNSSLDAACDYAQALSSFIPYSRVYETLNPQIPLYEDSDHHVVPIWANSSKVASEAANTARDCQVKALKRGCNTASVFLCNNGTVKEFLAVNEADWPSNHITINVEGIPVAEVGKMIVKWLFTVLSVRETLYLISEREMLAIDTKRYPDYKYCALKEARSCPKDAKLQFVALIATKPEVTEPDTLTWKVVDRSGEATFYFHHRGSNSQYTWDWVLNLKPGDRKVLPRMPMVALHEPTAKKVLLSPLRVTGATIRGVGYITMGIGRGVHWIGGKVSVRRSEKQKYMLEADWLEAEEVKHKAKEEKKKQKQQKKEKKNCCAASIRTPAKVLGSDFNIFNEKGEKTWSDAEDDTASTVATSMVDEKVEKEFC